VQFCLPTKHHFQYQYQKIPHDFHMFSIFICLETRLTWTAVYTYIYISWSLVESTIALGAKNNEIFFFSQFLWYQKLGEFFLKIRELSWIYTRKPHISHLFAQFLVEKYNKCVFGKQNHGSGSLRDSLGLLWKFWKPLNMLALWWWWWWDGWKVDVPKSRDDMIFIAFHYGHRGGGGDNPDFNPIQIALVLAHHHAWSLSLSLSLTHTFSIFHNRSSTPARKTTTLVKWFHSNFTSRSFCKSHHETMFDNFDPCAHLCMHTREFNLRVKSQNHKLSWYWNGDSTFYHGGLICTVNPRLLIGWETMSGKSS
jgi:hypothetical protein